MKPETEKVEAGPALAPALGSAMWRCTGCDVIGTWDEWKSTAEPGKHLCDVCLLDGRMSAKLVPLSPNDKVSDGR